MYLLYLNFDYPSSITGDENKAQYMINFTRNRVDKFSLQHYRATILSQPRISNLILILLPWADF